MSSLRSSELFLPKTTQGRDPISAREALKLGVIEDWDEQRKKWRGLGTWYRLSL